GPSTAVTFGLTYRTVPSTSWTATNPSVESSAAFSHAAPSACSIAARPGSVAEAPRSPVVPCRSRCRMPIVGGPGTALTVPRAPPHAVFHPARWQAYDGSGLVHQARFVQMGQRGGGAPPVARYTARRARI